MRYLVTGGAGFIGSHIAQRLLARGDSVVVLDDLSSGREENVSSLQGQLELLRADLCDPDALARAVAGVDGIFHHAAVPSVAASIAHPIRCDAVNVHGTLQLLEAARTAGVRRLVFAASAAAYGEDPVLPKQEDMRPKPLSPYAVSKVAAEHYVRVYSELYGMETVSLRYFNVFGPRQDPNSDYAAVVPKFITTMLAGRRPIIFGDGGQTRDFCFVGDVVSANLRALDAAGLRGQVLNVAGGTAMTIGELVSMLNGILGTHLEAEHLAARPGDIRHSQAGVSKVRSTLGWEPTVGVEEGLRRTVEHFRRACSESEVD